MSKKNFKTLQPKSIYDQIEFQQEPYSSSDKFNVYIPIEQDPVGRLIEKDRQLTKSKTQQNFHTNKHQQDIQRPPSESKLRTKLLQDIEVSKQLNNELVAKTSEAPKPQSPQRGILKVRSPIPQTTSRKAQLKLKELKGTTGSDFAKTLQKEKEIRKLKESLYLDERTGTVPKSTIKNNIIEDILQEGEVFCKRKDLLDSIYKLKSLNLLKNHDQNVNRFPGVGKISFVFNDYHSKSTNNGYSRNLFGGGFFTR